MKKILLATTLITTTFLFANSNNTPKGTKQHTLESLEPTPSQMDVNADITPKAIFSVVLDPKHLKKNDITLKHITQSKEGFIPGQVSYQNNVASFDPDQDLDEGYYEITYKSLKPLKPNKESKIREIKYRFYVPEVINGYKLPPEPDKALNNSTLLGVDVNDNGVRDDVERWIIKKYSASDYPKTKTEIALQWGRTAQQVIQNPETAYEDKKYRLIMRAGNCQMYAFSRKLKKSGNYRIDNKIFNDEFVDKVFNTKERIKAYYLFNGNLAGHVYGI